MNPEKSSYIAMQVPTFMYPCKMFTLNGFVAKFDRDLDYSKAVVLVITFRDKKEIRENFEVYFRGRNRDFANRYISEGSLINVIGELVISKDSTERQQIIKLDAKHVMLWRKYGTAYEQISEILRSEDIESNDYLAF